MKTRFAILSAAIGIAFGMHAEVIGTQISDMSSDKGSITRFERQRAEKLADNTKIIPFGDGPMAGKDSVRSLIFSFYENQFRHAQDPLAPYFLFMSKDAKLAMGIGGVVRMRGWFGWNNAVSINAFAPYHFEIPKDPAHDKNLGATPAGTDIYFTIIGKDSPVGNYTAFIEANFNGYNGLGFKLKKAYITAGDWTAGYATSTFSDPAAEPPTIDGGGPNGKMSRTNILVRYLHTFKGRWSVGGSLEFPKSNYAADDKYVQKRNDYIPDIAALAQYQWDGGASHVRLSGLLRAIPYRDLVTQKNVTRMGWGVQLSAKAKIANPLTLFGICAYGEGHASYSGDLSESKLDLIADPGHPGKMLTPPALSAIFGAKYNFTSDLYASLCLSELKYFSHGKASGDMYSYGLYGAVNVYWNIMPRLQIGLEYLVGKRMNFNGQHASANRIDAMFQLSF